MEKPKINFLDVENLYQKKNLISIQKKAYDISPNLLMKPIGVHYVMKILIQLDKMVGSNIYLLILALTMKVTLR